MEKKQKSILLLETIDINFGQPIRQRDVLWQKQKQRCPRGSGHLVFRPENRKMAFSVFVNPVNAEAIKNP